MKDFKFDDVEEAYLFNLMWMRCEGRINTRKLLDDIESLIQSRADADGCAAKDAEIAELKLRIECIETKFASAL